MKKYLVALLFISGIFTVAAQRNVKIAYIDMEYILDKVPDYAEARNQLEQSAQKWKKEIEVKRNEITKLKESLKAEQALLTKELVEEREGEIAYLEKELLDYQNKRFGPTGDLVSQRAVLVKPIQDQVFNIIQDVSESRKYDFVFDKSSDLTMLFAAKRHDISDLVVRRLTATAKRERLSANELKKLDEQEKQEELEADPEYQERQKALEDRKAERERKIEERNATRDAKRKEAEEKRAQQLKEREERRQQQLKEREEKRNKANGNQSSGTSATDGDDAAPANGNK